MTKKRIGVLLMALEDEVIEARGEAPFFARSSKADLRRLVQAIDRAARDRRIGAMVLRVARPQMGWSKAASLARAIDRFRASGKPATAFLEGAGHLDFALASSCDTIVMQPGATLDLIGLQIEAFFLRDLLARLGVEADLDAVGEFKSAGEIFTRRTMSDAHRQALEALLEDLSSQMVDVVAAGRGLPSGHVSELLEGGPYLADEARELGLVDRVDHEDVCAALLSDRLGTEVRMIDYDEYPTRDRWLHRLFTFKRSQVAVVYAVGVITPGHHGRPRPSARIVASRSFREQLKRVRESRRVKAVVLRIDSPGGAAVASDLIWREITLTRKVKPIVVSMGDIAASGGYYIATAADAILAEPSTLTGSIGILGGKVVARRLLDMLGVQRETVSLSKRSGFQSPTQS